MAGGFNMDLLDVKQTKKVRNFLHIMSSHDIMPIINKPTHVIKNTTTATGQTFINSVTATRFKTTIIKLDISDHFPIFSVEDCNFHIAGTKERLIFRSNLSDISNITSVLLAGTESKIPLIMHMTTLSKFLAHFMASVSKKMKSN